MKKGFTLVEMLVVVVVLVTLMSIVFRLTSIGTDTEAKNATINRLQRVENALSGYFAAFGTYPPVKLHGSRNPFLAVSDHGVQNTDGTENDAIWGWLNSDKTGVSDSQKEAEAWAQVKAACEAQPVACMFPYPDEEAYALMVEKVSAEMQKYAEMDDEETGMDENSKRIFARGFDNGTSKNAGRFSPYKDKYDWQEVQLFKFGLMSYLLPRYLVMMWGKDSMFDDYAQWTGNNELPSDPLTGTRYASWKNLRNQYATKQDNPSALAHVANIPSQAACARWMANFDSTLACNHNFKLFGVNIKDDSKGQENSGLDSSKDGSTITIYTPGGYDQDSGGQQYVLDQVTVKDGWGHDLYYYSPAPYQSYQLWSAGPNGRTFPPWISRENLDGDANACVGYWVKDDITGLRH